MHLVLVNLSKKVPNTTPMGRWACAHTVLLSNVLLSGSRQIFTAAFFICALVVASIDNAGFDVVLTGLLLGVWEVGAMWLLKRGPHETSVGIRVMQMKARKS